MDKENQKSHVEAGITAMKKMLADGDYDDVAYVHDRVVKIVSELVECEKLGCDVRGWIRDAYNDLETADILMERHES